MTPPNVIFVPASDTPLQTLVLSPSQSAAAADVTGVESFNNTGLEIVTAERTQGWRWSLTSNYWRIRLWNGAEAINAGATAAGGDRYAFATAAACRAWWDNYIVTIEMEGTLYDAFGDPVGGSAQTGYLNTDAFVIPLSVAEDCKTNNSYFTIRVYEAT